MTEFPELTATPATVPFDRAAEEALLGAFMINPPMLKEILINPADFYIHRHQWIYQAMLQTLEGGGQMDFLTLCDMLERAGHLAEIGGPGYLTGLISQTPSSLHAESYAGIVADRAQRRRMLTIATQIAKAAYDTNEKVDKAISQSAADLANCARPKGGAQHVSVFASRHYDRIEALAAGDRKVQRIPTGFIDFDRCLGGGLRIPEMLLLMGKPGLGKTKFILQLGLQMGQQMPGAIYEMETDEDQIMDREFSRRTKISDSAFETGQLQEDQWPLYVHAVEMLSDPKLTQVYLDFSCTWTTATLRADLARLKAEYGIHWYMVDYVKFLRDQYGRDEIERVNEICGRLKQINRELELASVVIHSMTKEGIKSQNPDLTTMSGGSGIAFDTDKALFMTPHIPPAGQLAHKDYRTFSFQKTRSRVNDIVFHLQAVKEFPAFLDVATPAQVAQEPLPREPRRRNVTDTYDPALLEMPELGDL